MMLSTAYLKPVNTDEGETLGVKPSTELALINLRFYSNFPTPYINARSAKRLASSKFLQTVGAASTQLDSSSDTIPLYVAAPWFLGWCLTYMAANN